MATQTELSYAQLRNSPPLKRCELEDIELWVKVTAILVDSF